MRPWSINIITQGVQFRKYVRRGIATCPTECPDVKSIRLTSCGMDLDMTPQMRVYLCYMELDMDVI